MLRYFSILLAFFIAFIRLSAQETILPHFTTSVEEKNIPAYYQDKSNGQRNTTSPPPSLVRTMGEWEQIQAVIITWAGQTTILKEIVRNAVKECKVLIITSNPAIVTDQLMNSGISLDSVQFIETPFNSIWVCDYGPTAVYSTSTDSLYLIDWIYNRPRPEDDATPQAIADQLGLPLYEATTDPDDLIHTGGNHLSDGMGNAFSSMLVLEENNDKTEAEIDSIAKKYLGVNHYIKFPVLPYDGIHHLDMHMRIIDEETIIFGEYPEGISDGPQIEANIDYLNEEVKTAFDHSYRVLRMPMPPDVNGRYPSQGGAYRTYTNSVFINKTLLVPTYEEKYDTTALRIYRENLPGYNVVGINCNSIISSLGALHCITKLVGVNDPLLIAHARLRDSENPESDYTVSALITHSSGIAEASLFYRLSGDSIYNKVQMIVSDSLTSQWSAVIPSQASGTEVQYYIEALSNSGKTQVRPIVAPQGYFNFRILGEPANQPPTASIQYPLDESVFSFDQSSLTIEMNAEDADGTIEEAILYINGDLITMMDTIPYVYDWTFPEAGDYEIQLKVKDDDGAEVWSEPVNVIIETSTDIEKPENEVINIYPNPVQDYLWIKNKNEVIPELTLTTSVGQTLLVEKDNSGSLVRYDLSMMPPGIYFLKWIVEGKVLSSKIVKR